MRALNFGCDRRREEKLAMRWERRLTTRTGHEYSLRVIWILSTPLHHSLLPSNTHSAPLTADIWCECKYTFKD